MPPDELIRLLHATYAAPRDGVTDAELLGRCAAGKDDAAFELLLRRHAGMVWQVCRSVVRDLHAAEDAFQATFLLVARNAGSFSGRGTAAGWLYRIARHAALKARAHSARFRPAGADLDSVVSAEPPDPALAELAQLLHEELGQIAEKYRTPLVLCYLEGHTHAEVARQLGWPVGTVATRITRGRDQLRHRLTRRGVSLPAAGFVAVFTAGSSFAVSPTLVSTTAGAITTGTLSPAVHHLAHGAQALMTPTRMTTFVALTAGVAFAAGIALAFAAPADPPAAPPPPSVEAREKKGEKPVPQPHPTAPGVQALATASTDIVVVEVLETNPTKAIEGARDTVRLKVTRTLLGRLAPNDTFGVYYHLLWADERGEVLEPPKFVKGQRYLLFLRSHLEDRGGAADGKRLVYEFTDPWLAVQPDHVGLVKETISAVRSAHGDAAGAWSAAGGPLQGRLVLVRSGMSNGTPIITAYLDLRNVAGGDNTVEVSPERARATWTVTDADGKTVAPINPSGTGGQMPFDLVTLPARSSARLTLSKPGAEIAKKQDGHLVIEPDWEWVFGRADGKAYYLQGKFEAKPTGERGQWSGTLDLPRVRIPIGRE